MSHPDRRNDSRRQRRRHLEQLQLAFTLFVLFQIKHFVADFPLQFPYMLRKFRPGWDFLLPLTSHCIVHAIITLTILIFYTPHLWWLAGFDFVAHFLMDRIKAGPRYMGRWNDMTKAPFWITFGLDQMVHHLTHTAIIWYMLTL